MGDNYITVSVRIEPELNRETEAIFQELGMTASEAIKIFLQQVKLYHDLPFDAHIPNKETQKAMAEAHEKNRLKSFATTAELFDDLEIA